MPITIYHIYHVEDGERIILYSENDPSRVLEIAVRYAKELKKETYICWVEIPCEEGVQPTVQITITPTKPEEGA